MMILILLYFLKLYLFADKNVHTAANGLKVRQHATIELNVIIYM